MADLGLKRIADLIAPFRVEPGRKVRLPRDFDPAAHPGAKDDEERRLLALGVSTLAELQDRLAAQDTYGLLVVLQALDAGGKDGTIKHVMSGVNPQGVTVTSFKVPSPEELNHDYLWRYTKALPARGMIGIFNRSHYEEVLVVRVHPGILAGQKLPPAAREGDVWARRFREINEWERYLVENGIRIVKLFLNVSKEEQRLRFLARIDVPDKNWKFSAADVKERAFWDDYRAAFEAVLSHTSTDWAPWHVIPADDKGYARAAAASVIAQALIEIDPHYPAATPEARAALAAARATLEAEAPGGGAARGPAAITAVAATSAESAVGDPLAVAETTAPAASVEAPIPAATAPDVASAAAPRHPAEAPAPASVDAPGPAPDPAAADAPTTKALRKAARRVAKAARKAAKQAAKAARVAAASTAGPAQ